MHTYRPDMKSAVERVMRSLALCRDLDACPGVDGRMDGTGLPVWSAPAVLGVAELADLVGGALGGYHLRFDPTDDHADFCRPVLVRGDQAVAVDVFVRRRGTSGEA